MDSYGKPSIIVHSLLEVRDEDFNPEQLMHELEDFLRQQREGRDD